MMYNKSLAIVAVAPFESYLSEIYTHLKELEINPKYVARYLEGLVSLVQDLNVEQGERANATSIQKKRHSTMYNYKMS